MNNSAIFLDRDGVLNIPEFRCGRSFAPKFFENFNLYPDALAATERLVKAKFRLFVVTNQPDVGMGLAAESEITRMHKFLLSNLPIEAIEVCYLTKEQAFLDRNNMRKPGAGMLFKIASEKRISLTNSFMIGDRASDIEAGRAAQCKKNIFIDRYYENEVYPSEQDFTCYSLNEAVSWILSQM